MTVIDEDEAAESESGEAKPDRETNRLAFETWLADRPPIIQEMAREFPGYICYKSKENRGHYRIYSYSEDGTLTLMHGRDSYLPGVNTFGQSPYQLIACDCGNWLPPTAEQIAETGRRIERMRKLRMNRN